MSFVRARSREVGGSRGGRKPRLGGCRSPPRRPEPAPRPLGGFGAGDAGGPAVRGHRGRRSLPFRAVAESSAFRGSFGRLPDFFPRLPVLSWPESGVRLIERIDPDRRATGPTRSKAILGYAPGVEFLRSLPSLCRGGAIKLQSSENRWRYSSSAPDSYGAATPRSTSKSRRSEDSTSASSLSKTGAPNPW